VPRYTATAIVPAAQPGPPSPDQFVRFGRVPDGPGLGNRPMHYELEASYDTDVPGLDLYPLPSEDGGESYPTRRGHVWRRVRKDPAA